MRNVISNDTPLGKIVCLIADLVILNILWFLCSIPIITMGPATAALYYTLSLRSRGEEQMTRTFMRGFKQNFLQALLVWLLILAAGFILLLNFTIIDRWESTRTLGLIILCLPILLYMIIVSYIYPTLAEFKTSIKQLLINSVLLSLAHFPRSLAIAFINSMPAIALFLFPSWMLSGIFLWLPIGFSLCAFLNQKLLQPVFAPYRPEESEPFEDSY